MRIEILIMDNDVVKLTQKLVKTPSIKGNTVDVANIIFDYFCLLYTSDAADE